MKTDASCKTPHDHFIKSMLEDRSTLIEFIKSILPENITRLTDFKTLKLEHASFVNEDLVKREADLLYHVKIAGKPAYFYILLEHQSSPDITMPLRFARYITLIQERHMSENKIKQVPFVFPIVFYNGNTKYSYPTDLVEMIDAPKEMLANYSISKFHLVDLNSISDKDIRTTNWAGILIYAMKHAYDSDVGLRVNQLLSILEMMPEEVLRQHHKRMLYSLIKYIMTVYQNMDQEVFMQSLQQSRSATLQRSALTIAEQLIAKGEARGEVIGMKLGRDEIIRSMLKAGMTSMQISEITQIPISEVDECQIKAPVE